MNFGGLREKSEEGTQKNSIEKGYRGTPPSLSQYSALGFPASLFSLKHPEFRHKLNIFGPLFNIKKCQLHSSFLVKSRESHSHTFLKKDGAGSTISIILQDACLDWLGSFSCRWRDKALLLPDNSWGEKWTEGKWGAQKLWIQKVTRYDIKYPGAHLDQ